MTWVIVAIVAGVVAFDVLLVVALVRFGWGPLASFPAVAPAADAVTRRFQSFRVNLLNLGFCIHVAADERHLHLTPVRPLRWMGARPASVPWERIVPVRRSARGRHATVRIGRSTVVGPAWCLDLAEGDASDA